MSTREFDELQTSRKQQLELILQKITHKNPDNIKIKYYPSYKVNSTYCIEVGAIDNMYDNIIKHASDKVLDNYIEYGIKDTFVNISNRHGTVYYRKELQIFQLKHLNGIFVIEIYNICDEYDFPYIINYHQYINCTTTTYKFDTYSICFIDTIDNSIKCDKNAKNAINICKCTYINADIDINNFIDSADNFISKIILLNKNISI